VIRSGGYLLNSATWLVGALALQGCATAARPAVLSDASSMLARKETSELQSQRPALVDEARQRLKEAELAHANGDDDTASLLANIAIARYQTAANFVERDAATALRRARLASEESTSGERKRLEELEAKLRQVEAKGKKDPALDAAHRLVLDARDRQAEAIREGAPVSAAERYTEGRGLVDKAVDALASGDAAEARRSATRAIAVFDEAILLARGKLAQAPKEPAEKPAGPLVIVTPPAASAPAPAPVPPPAPVPASERTSATRTLAEQRILDLQLRRTELLGQRADELCKSVFREFDATLDLAQKRFDARDYPRSLEIAVRAGERLRACDLTAEARKETRGAKDAKDARDARDAKEARRDEVTPRGKALKALQKAQEEQARATARHPEDKRLTQSAALVTRAEQWFEKSEFEVSEGFAQEASKLLAEIDGKGTRAPAKGKGDKAEAEERKDSETCAPSLDRIATLKKQLAQVPPDVSPQQKKQRDDMVTALDQAAQRARAGECSKADEIVNKANRTAEELPGASEPLPLEAPRVEADWRVAFETTQRAMKLREQVRPRTDAGRSLFARADAHLTKAKEDYQAKRFREAEMLSRIALEGFEAIEGVDAGAKPPALPANPAAVTAAPSTGPAPREPQAGPQGPAPQGPAPQGPAPQGPAPQGPASQERPPETVVVVNTPPGAESQDWGPAYRAVTEALTLRDRITPTAGDPDQAALQRASLNLGRARGAWAQKDYKAAQEYARSAVAEYTAIARSIRERAEKNAPRDKEALQREAADAVREARVAAEICEQERCDDRDNAEFIRGKNLAESARKALDSGDFSYALEMAKQSRRKLDEVAQKPRKNPPPAPVDPKEIEKQKQDAETALREAEIAYTLCKKDGCEKVDAENWLRAEQMLAAARRNQAAGQMIQTREQADQARELFKKIYDSKPRFKMPDGISKVALREDQLVLMPAPEFERGNANKLTPKSLEAVKELAAVIKANKDAVKIIRLVGYTDNRGSAAVNKSLSAGRARTILQALLAEGVPVSLVASEGRGPENPIADNNTADGRAANRRVEILLERK
jgi:outer membrane protein OmpA-like peptidoglycan-associated protein